MQAPVPAIEIAHHRDARCVRRPNGEKHAVHAFMRDQVGTEPAIELAVGAFHQEIIVDRPQNWAEGIRVGEFPSAAEV